MAEIFPNAKFGDFLKGVSKKDMSGYSMVEQVLAQNADVISMYSIDESQEYWVMAAYNPENGGIDLALIYSGDGYKDKPILLIGAIFAGYKDYAPSNLIHIDKQSASEIAPGIISSFTSLIRPHINFLTAVKISELVFKDIPPGYEIDKLSGIFNI